MRHLPPPGAERAALVGEVGSEVRAIAGLGSGIIDAPLLARLPNLEIISSLSAGLDGIDTDAVAARDIALRNTSAALCDDVADLALWLLVSVSRKLVEADRFARAGKWSGTGFPLSRTIAGLKVGIYGLGAIGTALAARLSVMRAEIGYHGRHQQADVPHRYFSDLITMADWCDAMVICAPATAQTIKSVDTAILGAIGPDGFVVNIARGVLIDEAALITALADRKIGGAGLDVFENEPDIPLALRTDDRVVVLPHLGSATVETRQRMADMMIAALEDHFARQS